MAAHLLLETGDVLLVETGDLLRREETYFDDIRQDLINGLTSAQAEAAGWNAVVKATLPVTAVVRTSDTLVTITLPAFGTYDITATETITDTIPASALLSAASLVATPTFTVTAVITAMLRRLTLLGAG